MAKTAHKKSDDNHVCSEGCVLRESSIEMVLEFIGTMLPQLGVTPAEAYVAVNVIAYGLKVNPGKLPPGVEKDKLYKVADDMVTEICQRADTRCAALKLSKGQMTKGGDA